MSGAATATARSEPIARRCGSEVMVPILPTPGPAPHRTPAITIRSVGRAAREVRGPGTGYVRRRGGGRRRARNAVQDRRQAVFRDAAGRYRGSPGDDLARRGGAV